MTHSQSQSPVERALLVYLGGLTLYALLAYGLTTEATKNAFDIALVAGFVLWMVDLVVRRRFPSWNRPVTVVVCAILAYGWTAVLNAQSLHSWEGGFTAASESGYLKWLPASIDQDESVEAMWHLTALALGFVMLTDLCRLRRNRRVLLSEVALVGLVIALVGLFQKASGTQTMLFFDEPLTEKRFFASYRYHGNAATFLNFCWPIAFVLFLRAKLRDSSPLIVAVWGAAFVFTLVAVFVNTSKMGQVLGLVTIPMVGLMYRKAFLRVIRDHPHPSLAGVVLGGLLLTITGFLIALSFSVSASRWFDFDTSANARLETYATCLDIIPMGGVLGLGPNTFSTIFPYFRMQEGKELEFFWHTAHQDYLQTIIEWGWTGFCLWGAVFGIVIIRAIKRMRSGNFYAGAILVGLGAAMIQAGVDFPFQIASLQWIALILIAWISASGSSKSRTKKPAIQG